MPQRPAPSKSQLPPHSPSDASKEPGLTAQERAFAAKLLLSEAAAVSAMAATLGPEFHAAVDLIVRCADAHGTVLISGLGKSGLIGQKISATLASLGITSHYVHPAEAVHGDLGRFRPADVCIALSYSGETDEVVGLASILRQDGLAVISITRGPEGAKGAKSSLERLATVSLAIGACDDLEISPAPTCSTTATLALGDALALCAARRRNFTDDDFAKRHPGGSLGGLLKPIADLLRFRVGKTLNVVPDDLTVAQALKQSETGDRRSGAMLLVDRTSGLLTGLFTDGDLRRLIERDRGELDQPIRAVMTRNPGTLPDTALVRDAVNMVREFRRDEIPVVDAAGRPIGLLDVQDLVAQRLIRSE
jgi:arabinose-5-phosphate isomerase